jgi:FixJ family two-component response regulator
MMGPPRERTTSHRTQCMNKKLIHLIEKDDVVRDSIKVLLESNGLEVRDFRTAAEFCRSDDLSQAGCLVLGFNRHIAEGLRLSAALRQRALDIPTIYVVGGGDSSTKSAVMRAGAFAYLERPIKEAILIHTVEDALHRSSTANRLRTRPNPG